MHHLPFLVQVHAFVAGDRAFLPGTVVLFEEFDRVAAGYDAGSLVLEEEVGVSFEDCGVVAVAFEGYACEETAEAAADLKECVSAGSDCWEWGGVGVAELTITMSSSDLWYEPLVWLPLTPFV